MSTFSSETFRARFHEFSLRRRLFAERSKIIVAVSGGVDSTVLLDLLAAERDALGLVLCVAHFNHQLRGAEADEDERLVRENAQVLGLECYTERAKTADIARHRKLSVQEAARQLRYTFFSNLLISCGFDRVSTAHNADDNAETVLMNLIRGAGVAGIAGIPVYRRDLNVIRPLLFATRNEIEAYAQAQGLKFRNDSSNDTDHYTRNIIRHHIVPKIQEHINPALVQTLGRTSDLFRELESYLVQTARRSLDLVARRTQQEELQLSVPALRGLPVLLQQYTVMLAVEQFTGRRPDFDQVERVLALTEGLSGTWVPLAEGYAVFRNRDAMVVRRSEPAQDFRIVIQQNHSYEFGRFRFASELLGEIPSTLVSNGGPEFVDADKIRPGDLVLRTWAEGDAFVPLGMKAMKKISDYFVDAKIPLYEKRSYPVLETSDGHIVWVCGQRIDERFKVTPETRRVLKLEFAKRREENHA